MTSDNPVWVEDVLRTDGYIGGDVMLMKTVNGTKSTGTHVQIIVRPQYSSRVYRLTARVEEIVEL